MCVLSFHVPQNIFLGCKPDYFQATIRYSREYYFEGVGEGGWIAANSLPWSNQCRNIKKIWHDTTMCFYSLWYLCTTSSVFWGEVLLPATLSFGLSGGQGSLWRSANQTWRNSYSCRSAVLWLKYCLFSVLSNSFIWNGHQFLLRPLNIAESTFV